MATAEATDRQKWLAILFAKEIDSLICECQAALAAIRKQPGRSLLVSRAGRADHWCLSDWEATLRNMASDFAGIAEGFDTNYCCRMTAQRARAQRGLVDLCFDHLAKPRLAKPRSMSAADYYASKQHTRQFHQSYRAACDYLEQLAIWAANATENSPNGLPPSLGVWLRHARRQH